MEIWVIGRSQKERYKYITLYHIHISDAVYNTVLVLHTTSPSLNADRDRFTSRDLEPRAYRLPILKKLVSPPTLPTIYIAPSGGNVRRETQTEI